VLFNETVSIEDLARIEQYEPYDMIFVVGTEAIFSYIIRPIHDANMGNKTTSVEINPGNTMISQSVDYKLAENGGIALSAIWDKVKPCRKKLV